MRTKYPPPWVIAALMAALLNIASLYLMCLMVSKRPENKNYPTYIPSIDMIKIRAKTKTLNTNKPKEQKIKNQPKTIKVKMDFQQNIPKKISHLPFKINLKLPSNVGINIYPKPIISPPPKVKGMYSLSELDSPLIPVIRLKPLYPMRARMLGIEGWVKVKFVVNEDGHTSNIEILDAKPKGIFEKSTKDAILKWRFKPPTVDKEPVKVIVETKIQYRLEK